MGIYSNLAVKAVQESASTVETIDTNPAGLLETAVALAEAEQAMFDALIELDFREAYVNKGASFILEADSEQVKESKIKHIWNGFCKMIEKVKNAIVHAVSSFVAKVEQLVGADKKLFKKFGTLKSDSFAGNEKEITVVDDWDMNYFDAEMLEEGKKKIADIANAKSAEEVDDKMAAVVEWIDNENKDIKEGDINRGFKKVQIQNVDVKTISDKMQAGFKGVVAGIKARAQKENAELKKAQDEVKKSMAEAKKNKDEVGVSIMAAQVKAYAKFMRLMTHEFNFRISYARKVITVARSNYVTLGNISTKKTVKESGVIEFVSEASDIAVNAIFEA